MFSRRGVCLACRLNHHHGQNARLQAQQIHRQFSAIASPAFKSHSSRRPLVSTNFPRRLHPLGALPPGVSSLPAHSFVSQTRLQSTYQTDPNLASSPSEFDLGSLPKAPLSEHWDVGYLVNHGIDFGWGPSSTVLWVFEHLHNFLGTEVGVSIIALAIFSRILTFPFVLGASDQAARFRNISKEAGVIQAKMSKAAKERDQIAMTKAKADMNKLKEAHGVKLRKMAYPLAQIPIGFGAWRTLRNASDIAAPGMATGGFLWFPNLTICDPYFVLPTLTALLQHTTVRFGGETGNISQQGQSMRKILLYFLPATTLVVTSMAPAAVQLTFATASGLSLLSNLILRNPAFRELFGLAARSWVTPSGSTSQPKFASPSSVYQGVLTVPNKNVEKQSQARQSVRWSGNSAISRFGRTLNPRNWFKGLGGVQDEVSKMTGGRISTRQDSKTARSEKAAKDKIETLEEKRRIQREIEKREWEKRDNTRR